LPPFRSMMVSTSMQQMQLRKLSVTRRHTAEYALRYPALCRARPCGSTSM
jgi:hypothetical protein